MGIFVSLLQSRTDFWGCSALSEEPAFPEQPLTKWAQASANSENLDSDSSEVVQEVRMFLNVWKKIIIYRLTQNTEYFTGYFMCELVHRSLV